MYFNLLLNALSLPFWLRAIYLNKTFSFPGKKTFAEFSVKGNIDTATTNGIDLGTRLITLDTDQDVTAQYEFFSLNVEKNLTLGGTFDAVDLEALDSIALKQSLDETSKYSPF